jgi:Zn-dependent metalloprotease
MDFLREHGHLFGIADPANELVLTAADTDAIEHRHTTYHQVHLGVPVFSGVVKVHQDAWGRIVAANGDFYPIKPTLSTTPSLTVDEAVSQAIAEIESEQPVVERSELVVVDPGWYGDPPIGQHLAYHVVLSDDSVPLWEAFFVDAHSGEILDRWTMICTARMRSIHDAEGGSNCCFEHSTVGCDEASCQTAVCERIPFCCQTQWTRTCAARAATYCGTLCLPGTLARSEDDPPTGVPDVDAAYDYFGDIYDYFFRGFGRDSLDDLGMAIVATVNSPAPGCPNAYWSGSRQQMVFCPGTVTDDIAAHELMHGVTDYTANLIYQNQPGQLNESFSDVFGELVDLFNGDAAFAGPPGGIPWPAHETGPGQDTLNNLRAVCSDSDNGYADGVRWLMGEDAVPFRGAIRDLWDPTCFGDPDFANSPLQDCDIIDSGGVHSGSGIPNHAFALLTDGGTFNGYTVNGIGPVKAGAVWYRALATYLTIASDFSDAYAAFNQAASDLIGTFPNDPRTSAPSADVFTVADAEQVDRALRAVEMDTPGRCGWTVEVLSSDPPNVCTARTIIFADDFESGINGWTFSNTGPFGPPTPYDWVQTTTALPFRRPGAAWHCEDRNIGNCADQDETARHSLFSPPIVLPAEADSPFVSFTHYMESEPSWDGGNVSIRVNGGEWRAVPRTAFEFNPFNSFIRGEFYGSSNPLGGQAGWTGVGGKWGTSVIDLRGLAAGGDAMEFRFDFGKDGCTGYGGWYVDDFVVYACPDCNLNGEPDHHEFVFSAVSPVLGPIGEGWPQTYTLLSPSPAAGDVVLSFTAMGDFSGQGEFISVDLNETALGTVFAVGGGDCPATPNAETIVVPAAVYNSAVGSGDAVISMTTTPDVNPALCGTGTFVTVFVQYPLSPQDADGNGIPDECEDCVVADPPSDEPNPTPKSRYLSFTPGSPRRHTALRVTLTDLPDRYASFVGLQMWVGEPLQISDVAGLAGETPPTFTGARLQCEPVFADWGSMGVVRVFDDEIVPEAAYQIQAVDLACGVSGEQYYSSALTVVTGLWGDVVGDCVVLPCGLPDGDVDFDDISAIMDKFRNLRDAPIKAQVDLGPDVPDRVVDFADIALVVDAFCGTLYPFDGPDGCP